MRVFRQTTAFSCGPRTVQIVFSHYGVFPGYHAVERACKTTLEGTYPEGFINCIEKFGLCFAEHEDGDATPDKIKKYTDDNIPVIVMWYAGGDAHVAAAYKVDDTFIYLLDPAAHLYSEPTILIRRTMLERCWKIHPDTRWMVAVFECWNNKK